MIESIGPNIFGLNFDAFLLLASGVFYILSALFILNPLREEKSELVWALFAFLIYQALNMFFMGLEFQTKNIVYSNIAALSVFIGSVYMLKFPFSSFSQGIRKNLFLGSLVIVFSLFIWFMQTKEKQEALMHFTIWYDIFINGIVVGGFMIILAFRTTERWLKMKAIGGGGGVLSCCVVSNVAMLSGTVIVSAIFSFLAPIFILGTLMFARKKQVKEITGM